MGFRGRYLTAALVAGTVLLLQTLATAPAQASTEPSSRPAANKVCPGLTRTFVLAVPPKGFARFSEIRVLDNCNIVASAPVLVPLSQAPATMQAKSGNGDPSYTAYQRSWDCCGILMNSLSTTLQWQAVYGGVYPYNQFNATTYHTEPPPSRGWWLDYQNLQYTGGCTGCSSDTLTGKAGFGYQGVFDPTGTLYYNSYVNSVTAYGDGHGSCSYTLSWRHSIPGWHPQQWCAYS